MRRYRSPITATAPTSTFTAFRYPNFRRFFAATSVANVGQFLQALATPFLIKELTDSNAWVGVAGFAVLFPSLIATPVAGILADRFDRRLILTVAYTVQATATAGFLLLHLGGALTPWRIIGLQTVAGLAAGFQWAPIQSMSAVLVPPDALVHAVRLVSISFTAGRAVGPLLAAVVLAFSGPGLAYGGTLACYLVGLALLATVRIDWTPSETSESFLVQFREGLAYVWARPAMRLVLLLAFSVAGLGAVFGFSLVASVSDDAFGGGGGTVGLLAAMIGIGSVVSSIFIASSVADRIRRSRLELTAVTIYGVGLLVTAATTTLAVGLAGYLLIGMAHMLHNVNLNTALQVQVEEAYRGRVLSVWLMALLAGLPIGALVGGVLADVIGIRAVLVAFACALLAIVGITAARTRGLALLDESIDG